MGSQKITSFYCCEGKDRVMSSEEDTKQSCRACRGAVILTLPPCHGDLHNM